MSIRLEEQIRRYTQTLDGQAAPLEELVPAGFVSEFDGQSGQAVEITVPLGPLRRRRTHVWVYGLAAAVAVLLVSIPVWLLVTDTTQDAVDTTPTTVTVSTPTTIAKTEPTTETDVADEPIPEGMLQNPGNGHFYEAVPSVGGLEWSTARAEAESRSFRGVQGHLVTITSEQEDLFIREAFSQIIGRGPWLGGFQPEGSTEPDGEWQWVTGEPFGYTNWGVGEPNNGGDNEACLQYLTGPELAWNDFPCSGEDTDYLVEYDTDP